MKDQSQSGQEGEERKKDTGGETREKGTTRDNLRYCLFRDGRDAWAGKKVLKDSETEGSEKMGHAEGGEKERRQIRETEQLQSTTKRMTFAGQRSGNARPGDKGFGRKERLSQEPRMRKKREGKERLRACEAEGCSKKGAQSR